MGRGWPRRARPHTWSCVRFAPAGCDSVSRMADCSSQARSLKCLVRRHYLSSLLAENAGRSALVVCMLDLFIGQVFLSLLNPRGESHTTSAWHLTRSHWFLGPFDLRSTEYIRHISENIRCCSQMEKCITSPDIYCISSVHFSSTQVTNTWCTFVH